jgi:hypothetical protein
MHESNFLFLKTADIPFAYSKAKDEDEAKKSAAGEYQK